MSTTYKLQLHLGEGALDANPSTYDSREARTLKVPLRPGYRFVGWIEEGNDVPQAVLTIPKGSTGERSYTAVWEKISTEDDQLSLNRSAWGIDDGVEGNPANPDGRTITPPSFVGEHGEDVYVVKTVYTEITLDGERDAAYSYGVHLSGALPNNKEYYQDRDVNIDLWAVRGQDGRCYVFGEITDPEIVVNEELFDFKPYHCDAVHLYLEPENYGIAPRVGGVIVASENPRFFRGRPKDCVVKRTEYGFCFELAFDHTGVPLQEGDLFGFCLYYNDTNEFHSVQDYKRAIVRLPSRRNPATDVHHGPLVGENDAWMFSLESATGKTMSNAEALVTGDLLTDLCSGARKTQLLYDNIAPAHTLLLTKKLAQYLRVNGAAVFLETQAADAELKRSLPQILVGRTAHPESMAREAALAYNAYELCFSDEQILLSGWKEEALKAAGGLLLSAIEYVKAGGKTADLATVYRGTLAGVPGDEIPKMEGISSVTDAADGSYQLLRLHATKKDFVYYCKALRQAGFSLWSENRMTSVHCATYFSETAIVNVTYGENRGDRSLRAVVDPRTESTLPVAIPAAYTPKCESSITQLAPAKVTWMTYAVKLDNGEFFVIDSGGNGAHKYIHDALLRLNDGKPVVVAAWLFTHFHIDHVGGFVELISNEEEMRDITVRSVIYNFPQQQVIDTARISPGDMRNMRLWKSIVKKSGAVVYKARTGQKYRFGNAELEMLFTFEDLAPYRILVDRSNPTSHIFSMKINGQKFMILGDAAREATTLAVLRYGKDLKSDFVQLSHHGHGDGGTDPRFYPLVDAPWVLWPGITEGPRPNGISEAWAVEHSKKYFKNRDEDTTLPIPYMGDE